MTSLAKIESNRRNALNSTGPRTQEGKERSRRNALRHGLTARTLVFPAFEDEADFRAFAEDMTADLAPDGACETMLAQRVILLAWRLERIAHIEAEILTGEAHVAAAGTGLPPAPGVWPEEMVQIARYEATLDRALSRAMKMFRERQEARLAGRVPDAAEISERSQIVPHPPALPRGPLPLPLAGEGAERSEAGEGAADSAKRSQIAPLSRAPASFPVMASAAKQSRSRNGIASELRSSQ